MLFGKFYRKTKNCLENEFVCLIPLALFLIKLSKWAYARLWLVPYLKADDDFILRVAPLHNRKSPAWRDYYPPPRYGIPPNHRLGLSAKTQYTKYGLFLWPGKVARQFLFSSLLIFLFVPLIFLVHINPEKYFCGAVLSATLIIAMIFLLWFIIVYLNISRLAYFWQKYGIIICFAYIILIIVVASLIDVTYLSGSLYYLSFLFTVILVSWLIFVFLYWRAPAVLSNIWASWPKAQYERFSNVAHKSDLSFDDILKKDEEPYWQPDKPRPMKHQRTVYGKGTRSLQEVLLHLAVFDFLFESNHNKKARKYPNNTSIENNEKELGSKKESNNDQYERYINSNTWLLYFFSPVWISFLVLMVVFCIYAMMQPHSLDNSYSLIVQFPYGFIIPLGIWGVVSLIFVARQRQFLINLHHNIKDNYFDTHLELVPQQILNELTRIPSEMHIKSGIEEMDKVQGVVQTVALLMFLAMMEIFASGYGSENNNDSDSNNKSSVECRAERNND